MVSDPFAPLLGNLAQMGFYRFVLPWFFTMAIIYGILLKSKMFEGQQAMNALIAVIGAFFLVNYTPAGFGLDTFFTNLFGVGILVLAAIFVGLLFVGLLGIKGEDIFKAESFGGATAVLLLVGLGAVLLLSSGGFNIAPETIAMIVVIVLMIVFVLFMAKGGK